ncbi:CHAT domain-containing protein [Picosynechococcus sp. PCC 7117]|uniref:CHAT domain-containing protein n=2 Tax=Picosynechococcus sp. PCC 7117 TaxID=195498 RepID=UPI0009033B34
MLKPISREWWAYTVALEGLFWGIASWASLSQHKGANYQNKSIDCYKKSLKIFVRTKSLKISGTIHCRLALAYKNRIEGERRENLELAIYHYQQALTVRTKEAYPEDWARTQNNLASAYSDRIEGERRENLELAIYHYQQALTVYTKEAYPEDWARTQNNLASAYSNRIEGERRENLELAIYHYQQALTVYTKEAYPEDWARTQNNLALAYSDRIEGERRENLELAIYHYQQALTVSTEEAYPEDWARTQNNLASAYSDRIEGERRENLELAIYHYQQALTVMTKNGFPLDCLSTSSLLGDLYLQQESWPAAIETYQTAIECIELLTSWSTDEDYKQQIIAENIRVYDNIIQAYVVLRNYDEAITYAERGRSRRLVDLIASNDLYANAEIPPEIQDYLTRYEALERQLYNLRQADSPEISDGRLSSSHRKTNLSSEEQEARLEQIQVLETEKQTLWRDIRRADPVIAQQIQVEAISFGEIAALLPNLESAILSIYNTGAETHIFVIRQRAQETEISLHSCPDLTYGKLEELLTEQWLLPYQEENNQQWQVDLGQNLQNIAQALKLEQLIQDHLTGIQELIIIPHQGLHHIPFAALPLGDAQTTATSSSPDNSRIKLKDKTKIKTIQSIIHETYLGDHFQIRVLPSCQILKYCHDRSKPEKITYGIVENASDDLKFTHIEAQRLRELETVLPENYLRGKAEVTVKNYQDLLARVENIHSAHHAESNLSNPRESALKLGDGNFSLGSLMLKRYPNLNHVFLSCCETNLGKPELTDDLLTLGTGFLCAGARTVISSLWAVDDRATAIFSSYYYEALKQTQKPSLALQQAQQRLRKVTWEQLYKDFPDLKTAIRKEELARRQGVNFQGKDASQYPFADPYYWSGFICQGV